MADPTAGPSATSIYKTLEKLDDSILEYKARNHLDPERKIIWDLLHTTIKAAASIAFSLGNSGERWG